MILRVHRGRLGWTYAAPLYTPRGRLDPHARSVNHSMRLCYR